MLQVKEVRLPALTQQAGFTYCIMCSRGPNRAEHDCVRCDITLLAHIAGEMLSPGQVCRAEPHGGNNQRFLCLAFRHSVLYT